ncbi:MAG: hypothetical protein H6765_01230 [Candidatus Peribacteria bacterium]|nr:MAG: hypothetical protein H6765_01230 [Candidatus Peribacteria bacterium]
MYNGENTWRIQISQHPDHLGKILVYRTRASKNSDPGKKTPQLQRTLNIYENIFEYLRSEEHLRSGNLASLHEVQNLLATIRKMKLSITDKEHLPASQDILELEKLLENKQDPTLRTIARTSLPRLGTETHPERARTILWGITQQLLKKVSSNRGIHKHVDQHANLLGAEQQLIDISRRHLGGEMRKYLATDRQDKTLSEIQQLLSKFKIDIAGLHTTRPYANFVQEISQLLA